MLEQPEILLRAAEEDGHLVEPHAALGFVEHSTDDLNGFTSFTRRRKHADVAGPLSQARLLCAEHETPQVRQIARRVRFVSKETL